MDCRFWFVNEHRRNLPPAALDAVSLLLAVSRLLNNALWMGPAALDAGLERATFWFPVAVWD
jgi:hypothetical protein